MRSTCHTRTASQAWETSGSACLVGEHCGAGHTPGVWAWQGRLPCLGLLQWPYTDPCLELTLACLQGTGQGKSDHKGTGGSEAVGKEGTRPHLCSCPAVPSAPPLQELCLCPAVPSALPLLTWAGSWVGGCSGHISGHGREIGGELLGGRSDSLGSEARERCCSPLQPCHPYLHPS